MGSGLVESFEALLGVIARMFADEGNVLAVSLLAMSKPRLELYNDWNDHSEYKVYFEVPEYLYKQIDRCEGHNLEETIMRRINQLTPQFASEHVSGVTIAVELVLDDQWRDKAKAYVAGQGVTNQGRARSDNLAPRMCDGLLFRSQQEIHLYRALKSLGVSFAPLPVFVRGGNTYRRIEPDFVVIKAGIVMVVEVDGDTVHHESPQEAHDRIAMLSHEGVHVERVKAGECDTPEKARQCADKVMAVIKKLKANR